VFLDLRKHDVAFLLTVRPVNRIGTRYNPNEPFVPQVGLVYVRGCEIEGMLDEAGKVIEEGLYMCAHQILLLCNRRIFCRFDTVVRNVLCLGESGQLCTEFVKFFIAATCTVLAV